MRVLLLNYEYPPCGSGAGLATAGAGRGAGRARRDGGRRDRRRSGVVGSAGCAGTARRTGGHAHGAPRGEPSPARRTTRGSAARSATWPRRRRRCATCSSASTYDVVHFVFSLPDRRDAAAARPARRAGDRLAAWLGRAGLRRAAARRSAQAHRLLHPLTRWIWRRADRVLVPSESLGRLAQRTDARLRYSVVPGGVDLARFRPRVALRRLPDGVVRCLAVARLVERNGLDDLLDALALLERGRYQLEIVGTGPYEARAPRAGAAAGPRGHGALHRLAGARARWRAAAARPTSSRSRPGSSRSATRSSRRWRRGCRSWAARPAASPSWWSTAGTGCWCRRGRPRELAHAISYLAADPASARDRREPRRRRAHVFVGP